MVIGIVIISFIIGIGIYGATDSLFLGALGFFSPLILLWGGQSMAKNNMPLPRMNNVK